LRLAIRDGYANFYCGGQSIAEVRAGRGLSAKIHKKYTTDVQVVGQEYVHLSDVEPQIEAWMTRMHRHQGLEKLLVDELCAANGGLIDMEAGLPGLRLPSPTTGIPRAVALRLDLVVLEPCDDGWTAALWEAKLPKNSSVSTTSDVPAVLAQRGNYADWFRLPGATEAILAGYRETCVQMVALHDRAGEIGIQLLPLHESITAIAADPSRLKAVDPKLRLVIDIRHMGKGFETDHVPRLRAAGIQVHLVRTNDDLVLPAGRAT
jgi:hypothetical protein